VTRPLLWTGGAWLLVVSGLSAVLWAACTTMTPRPAGTPPVRAHAEGSATLRSYAADSLGAIAVARDLFRAERHPAPAPYDPVRLAASPPGPPTAPKPVLLLKGLVWGAVPEAVVEGLPGVDGPRVLRVGEGVGGLRVQRIEAGRVVIAGLDTIWILTLRRP
jgi:hypothetical protein